VIHAPITSLIKFSILSIDSLTLSEIISVVHDLDGIEFWNMKYNYDGRFSPRPRNFRILSQAKQSNERIWGYGGLDLHWKYNFPHVWLSVASPALDTHNITSSLREGNFYVNCKDFTIKSSGKPLKKQYLFRFFIFGLTYDLLLILSAIVYKLLKLLRIDSIIKPLKILRKYF